VRGHPLGVAKGTDREHGPQLLRCSPFHPHRPRLLRHINPSAVFRRQLWLRGPSGWVIPVGFQNCWGRHDQTANSLSLCRFDDAHFGWCRKRSIPDIRRALPREFFFGTSPHDICHCDSHHGFRRLLCDGLPLWV
jgi:hypothetical protein